MHCNHQSNQSYHPRDFYNPQGTVILALHSHLTRYGDAMMCKALQCGWHSRVHACHALLHSPPKLRQGGGCQINMAQIWCKRFSSKQAGNLRTRLPNFIIRTNFRNRIGGRGTQICLCHCQSQLCCSVCLVKCEKYCLSDICHRIPEEKCHLLTMDSQSSMSTYCGMPLTWRDQMKKVQQL